MKLRSSLVLILVLMVQNMSAMVQHDPRLWYKKCKTITIRLPPPTCLGNAMMKMGCYRYTQTKAIRKRCNWAKKHPQGLCPKGCLQKRLAKAGCYRMHRNAAINAQCHWIRKNKKHLCSPPKTCLQKALKKAGCYVYKKSK